MLHFSLKCSLQRSALKRIRNKIHNNAEVAGKLGRIPCKVVLDKVQGCGAANKDKINENQLIELASLCKWRPVCALEILPSVSTMRWFRAVIISIEMKEKKSIP